MSLDRKIIVGDRLKLNDGVILKGEPVKEVMVLSVKPLVVSIQGNHQYKGYVVSLKRSFISEIIR